MLQVVLSKLGKHFTKVALQTNKTLSHVSSNLTKMLQFKHVQKHLVFHFFPYHHPSESFRVLLGVDRCFLRAPRAWQQTFTHTLLLMLKVYFCYRCNNKRPFKSDLKIFRRNWLQHWGVAILILASGSVQEKMDRFLWNALCVRI